ncbi:MAG: DegT/DnrJ/EryC1/StrS family aminotransferase [Candidatus Marinimicrobia bacterium]|nr:DegT/DnrJ/EryC1/StrS family aminotransferase [Candidatus Neomarinimicrobiota bacterium]
MIVPHYRPSFSSREITAVREVIDSGYIAQGKRVAELETTLAEFVEKEFGVAVSSGTTALILALKALKVSSGDEVIIPAYTCTALWHAVKAVDGVPVFADIETKYWNLDPDDVKRKITPKTKAVIFPHMFGQPGRIQEVSDLGIPVIEDIAQSIGAQIDGRPVGTFGAVSIGSFYATKVIGAGEGGIIFSDEKTDDNYLRDIREYDEKETLTPRINAKMNDITATIALEQLRKLPEFTARRNKILAKYESVLKDQILIPVRDSGFQSNLYRCIISLPEKTAAELIQMSKGYGITLRKPVYKPIHTYFDGYDLKNTESAWKKQVSIPIFPDMTDFETETVINFLKLIFGEPCLRTTCR